MTFLGLPLPEATERLAFRAPRPDDAPWLAAAWSDAAYAALLGEERPATPELVWDLLERRRTMGELDVVFERRRDGQRVGRGSIQELDEARYACEIELEIPDPLLRGQGFGREALAALLRWARGPLARRRVGARIAAGNLPSLALGRALGFRIARRGLPAPGQAPVISVVWSEPHGIDGI